MPGQSVITAEKLKPLLEKLINEMIEKKELQLPNGVDKDDFIETLIKGVTENVMGNVNLSSHQFRHDNRDALQNLIALLQVSLKLELKHQEKLIANPSLEPEPKIDPTNKEELKEKLIPLLTAMNELTPSPKPDQAHKFTDEEIKEEAEKLAADISSQLEDKNLTQEEAANAASASLSSLFGIDPSGEKTIGANIQAILGNLMGFPDFNVGGGENYMAEMNTANSGKFATDANPTTLFSAVANASGDMVEPLEEEIGHLAHPSPTLSMGSEQ